MALITTTTQAAQALGCSPVTLRLMCRDGRLPAQKSGRDWLIDDALLPTIVIAHRGGDRSASNQAPHNTLYGVSITNILEVLAECQQELPTFGKELRALERLVRERFVK